MTNPNPATKSCVFEVGKTYRTRGGRDALIYCTDAPGRWPIHGRVGESVMRWYASGSFFEKPGDCDDLLPPTQPRIREKWWVNVYPKGRVSYHLIEASARTRATDDALRIAVPCELVEIVGEEASALESPAAEPPTPESPKLLPVGTRVWARAKGLRRTIARTPGVIVEVDMGDTALPYRVWFTEGPNNGHSCWCSADDAHATEGEGV